MSTKLINLVDITKLPCYPHRCSTTVSLETFTLLMWGCPPSSHKGASSSCHQSWESGSSCAEANNNEFFVPPPPLVKSADDFSVKAEETGQMTLVIKSNALRKEAKDKTLQLQDVEDKLNGKLEAQPRSQGFSREGGRGAPPTFKGKVLGTRLVGSSKTLLKHFGIIFVELKLLYFCISNYLCTSLSKMSFQRLMSSTMAELFIYRK